MDTDQLPQTKAELVQRIEASKSALLSSIHKLPVSERDTVGPDGWTIAQHLAHIVAWQNGIAALLRREDRAAGMDIDRDLFLSHDLDAINEFIARRSATLRFDEALAVFHGSYRALLATLENLDDSELQRQYTYFQPDEPGDSTEPIVSWIAGNSYGHYDEHKGWMARRLEQRNQARESNTEGG